MRQLTFFISAAILMLVVSIVLPASTVNHSPWTQMTGERSPLYYSRLLQRTARAASGITPLTIVEESTTNIHMVSTDDIEAIPIQPIDLATLPSVNSVALGDNSSTGPINTNFTVRGMGENFTQVNITSEGYLQLGAGSAVDPNNVSLPNASAPNSIIAPKWDNFNPTINNALIYYQDFDSCPTGEAVPCFGVQWDNYLLDDSTPGGTFQAWLYQGGNMSFHYPDAGSDGGSGSTTGIENSNGTIGLTFGYNSNYLSDDLTVNFLNPGSNWTAGLNMPTSLTHFAFAQNPEEGESTAYIFSGVNSSFQLSSSVWKVSRRLDLGLQYDRLADIPIPVEGAGATWIKGKFHVIGGYNWNLSTDIGNYHQIYNPKKDTWKPGAPLPRHAFQPAIYGWKDIIAVAGGEDALLGPSSEVDLYSVSEDKWTGKGSSLPFGIGSPGFTQTGYYGWLAGGWLNSTPDNSAYTGRLDLRTFTWEQGPNLTDPHADGSMIATRGYLFHGGGDAPGGGFFDESRRVYKLDLMDWPNGPNSHWRLANVLADPFRGGRGACFQGPGYGEGLAFGGQEGYPVTTIYSTAMYHPANPCLNIFLNSSFEVGNHIPDTWDSKNTGKGDKRTDRQSYFGDYSLQIKGSNKNEFYFQNDLILQFLQPEGGRTGQAGSAGDTFRLVGWSKAKRISRNGGPYRMEAKFFWTDAEGGGSKTYKKSFKKGTHGWQYKKKVFTVPKDYDQIRLTIRLKKQTGKAWFDGVQLEGPW